MYQRKIVTKITIFINHVYALNRNTHAEFEHSSMLQSSDIESLSPQLKIHFYYSCVFGNHNYRVLVRVSVCVCVCVCVCFSTITQEEIDLGTRNWNTL